MSRARQSMYNWINSREGRELANNTEGRPRYLGQYSDQPFPLNPLFRSQPVLDEHTKELIWDKVTQRGEALKAVSAEMGVDVRRVAAVVRLKQVEKQWVQDVSSDACRFYRCCFSLFFCAGAGAVMMRLQFLFSISLEDLKMVRRLLLIQLPYFCCSYTCFDCH